MTKFVLTPTYVDYISTIDRSSDDQVWILPSITFKTEPLLYASNDPLNEDPRYRKEVIKHFYTRLTEKWLYKYPSFKSLLKYFKTERKGSNVRVSLIDNIDDASRSNVDDRDKKYVFKYIEKVFITKKFIRRVLTEYVKTTHIKWYDLYFNTSTLKDLFVHKLKKLIVSTVYDLEGKQNSDKEL